MKTVRGILVGVLFGAAAGGWLAVSCAIDDDIAWGQDPHCTGTCAAPPASSYACDINSDCTPSEGCTDWDCNERMPGSGPRPDADNAGDGALLADAGDDWDDAEAGADAFDGEDACVPAGVGLSRDTAEPVTLGVERPGLTACLAASGWLRFDVAAGTRFQIELSAADGVGLAFQIYAGTDPAVLAAATIAGSGSFGIEAPADTTYFLRVRATAAEPTAYSMVVRRL
jgi:hypothetical protein